MKKYHKIVLLAFILLIATVLRFWQLGSVPIAPDWDEAALGYNAYSILHTGKDEYGSLLPVVLRSFDDYKPALYSYLIIPFLPLFDLSVFTVRLPSALFGILTVVALYFLIKELFFVIQARENKYCEYIALLSAFLFAISPWHIQFSRVAFESNVGLAFNVLMVLFFLKAIRKPKYFFISVFFAVCAIYTYQSEKVFTPLLFIALLLIFMKDIIVTKKTKLLLPLFFGLIIMLPMLFYSFTNKEAFARARGVSIFSQQTSLLKNQNQRYLFDVNTNNIIGLVFDNWRGEYGRIIISNYLAHFNPNWLFIQGDFNLNRHHAPDMGLEYLVFLPFLLIGIYQLIFGQYDRRIKLLLFFWLLIAPIPASITIDSPHSVRTLNFLPTLQIFIAVGIITTLIFMHKFFKLRIKHKLIVSIFSILFLSLFIFNFSYYLNQYFIQQNYEYAYDWQYGYKDIVEYLKPIYKNYNKVIVSNRGVMTQSYMFFLFYLKYDPIKYLKQGGTLSGNYTSRYNKFENFEFRTFDYFKEQPNVLFVGTPGDFQEVFKVINTVQYPNKTDAIRIVERK